MVNVEVAVPVWIYVPVCCVLLNLYVCNIHDDDTWFYGMNDVIFKDPANTINKKKHETLFYPIKM